MTQFLVGQVVSAGEAFQRNTKVDFLGVVDTEYGGTTAIEEVAQYPGDYFVVEVLQYPVRLRVDSETEERSLEVDVP